MKQVVQFLAVRMAGEHVVYAFKLPVMAENIFSVFALSACPVGFNSKRKKVRLWYDYIFYLFTLRGAFHNTASSQGYLDGELSFWLPLKIAI